MNPLNIASAFDTEYGFCPNISQQSHFLSEAYRIQGDKVWSNNRYGAASSSGSSFEEREQVLQQKRKRKKKKERKVDDQRQIPERRVIPGPYQLRVFMRKQHPALVHPLKRESRYFNKREKKKKKERKVDDQRQIPERRVILGPYQFGVFMREVSYPIKEGD
ncbi:hypothetical protein CEXT_728781 [Caerostris extrusa]|uniref:Uncharacterized protein n=1 Tax=Caerostris extrusa TaxID=172846 RepID=A0AAV4W747_CAEEX|nr:hypothetical protein CEXT_728781 [Caerostris extrusa]